MLLDYFKQFMSIRHQRKCKIVQLLLILTLVYLISSHIVSYNRELQKQKGSTSTAVDHKQIEISKLKATELQNLIESNKKLHEQSQYEQLKLFKSAKIIDNKNLEFFKQIQRRRYNVNCRSIVEWNETEVRTAKRLLYQIGNDQNGNYHVPLLPDENFIFEEPLCNYYRSIRGYDDHIIDKFEFEFPIAFSVLTYENVEQFERLLRVIYRPHNVYCIHIDSKSSSVFKAAVRSITNCFNNVFIATKSEKIIYASFNRLKADLNCMHDLLMPNYTHPNLINKNLTTSWKYLLNLASTEFPLRTNYELTKILNIFNGANDIEVINKFPQERVHNRWIVKKKNSTNMEYMFKTPELKKPTPHNFTIVKGLAYCSFSRKFVEFALLNKYAQNLLYWSRDTYSPDEWYWATLQFNTQFNPPGGFRDSSKNMIISRARFVGWNNNKYKCMGKLRHNICIFSLEDLPKVTHRLEFFLNKFLLNYDPISYQCIEEWLLNKISMHQTVDVTNYCKLPFLLPYSVNPRCAGLA